LKENTHIGSQEIAIVMPTAMPRKLNSTCQRLKLWLLEKDEIEGSKEEIHYAW
jgi:hypothetical protein